MSAQDELPPGWRVTEEQWMGITGPRDVWVVWNAFDSRCPGADGIEGFFSRDVAVGSAWLSFGITREEYTTMRLSVLLCDEARRLHTMSLPSDRLAAALSLVAQIADKDKELRAAVERCAELETALAKVTAERDEARRRVNQLKVYTGALEGNTRPGFWEAD